MKFIASEKVVWRSPDPQNLYGFTPWLADGFNGRIIMSFDISGTGISAEPGPKSDFGDYGSNQCQIFVSDDRGENWRRTARLPLLHARVFKAEQSLWIIGHSGRLLISQSIDNGESWSEPAVLDDEFFWQQAACAMDFCHGRIYLTMEHAPCGKDEWHGGNGDPVLMSADLSADLSKRESWRFSNALSFKKDVPHTENLFAYRPDCCLESNVVRIRNRQHRLYDPKERTVLLFCRCGGPIHTANLAALFKGEEAEDGSLRLDLFRLEDGSPMVFVPFPGGYMKFHIIYDEKSGLYWLIASRAEYSGFLPIPGGRNDLDIAWERGKIELFYSRTLFDWCSAGMVAAGNTYTSSRHYASLLIDGDDLLVLSRSGDEKGKNPHDTNLITLHRVKNFRDLA